MLLGGVPVDVVDAMAALLELFVSEGRRRFDGATPDCIALTHPVAWSEERKAVLVAAARKVVRGVRIVLIDEPVASARYFASAGRVAAGSHLAVYDLGGGTFDAAVLTVDGSDFKVVGEPGGSDEIGGEGFDERVFAFLGEQIERFDAEWWTQVTTNPERRYASYAADLFKMAREAKEALSKFDTSSTTWSASTRTCTSPGWTWRGSSGMRSSRRSTSWTRPSAAPGSAPTSSARCS
nr:hypothetical protein GCM10020093_028140 [Planobispora longispora]